MIQLDLSNISLPLKHEGGKAYVFDTIRKGWYVLTPEEHVRQYLLHYLINSLQYPQGLIAVEKRILVGTMPKRFDIVVYDGDHKPWLLAKCKAPDVTITDKALQQLLSYQRSIQSRYWLLGNGRQLYCADSMDPMNIQWLNQLPAYSL